MSRILVLYLLLILVGGIGGWLFIDGLAYKTCRVEAGGTVTASDFIKSGDEEAYFTQDSAPFDTSVPGEYPVKVRSGYFTHKATLIVQDTIPPRAVPRTARIAIGAACDPRELVTDIEDATQVSVYFESKPDYSIRGSQTVKVLLVDAEGNCTSVKSELIISQVVGDLYREVGSPLPGLSDFVVEAQTSSFQTDISVIDMNKIGDYEVNILADGYEGTAMLHVVDTTPPTGQAVNVSGYLLAPHSPEEFVTNVSDATHVSFSWQQEPDLTKEGTQDVGIVLTDEGGNETAITAQLTLKEDTEPPVITGTRDIEILTGEGISYRRGVEVTDNCPEGLELTVDSSNVNSDVEGVYEAVYLAKDLAGNTATARITVTVRARKYSEEEINKLADAVLEDIFKPDMTLLDKVEAIYNYNLTHISYISHSDKGDWTQAAYEGLVNHAGDCFVYASTAKVLLTRAGITNMDIAKIPAETSHYWNLVDIGDGWYHLDTTPRKDHPRIFMWTDEQLMDYSEKHNKSHNYDHSLYPEVN